ncbi:MAG: TlpA family protein disulfide reductase [Pyrinomonadaceae bacterium]
MRKFLQWPAVLLLIFVAAASVARAAEVEPSVSQPTKLVGQIVCCEECWARDERRTVAYGMAKDLAEAVSCVANGDPTLLAVTDASSNAVVFYQLEEGKFKRPGENWLEYVGRRVEVTGSVKTKGEKRSIKVDALDVIAPAAGEVQQASAVGREAELALNDLSGVGQQLAQFRGRVVVINFWATYCAPCRKEMPDLAAIQNEYAALGVQVIGASADTAAERAKVLQFIKETKLNFPVWLGASVEDMARFGLGPALPGTAIINREGRIVWNTRGIVKQAELKKQLEALLTPATTTTTQPTEPRNESAKGTKPGEASSVPS